MSARGVKRRKPTDAVKSPALFERNAWRICPVNGTMLVSTKKLSYTPEEL